MLNNKTIFATAVNLFSKLKLKKKYFFDRKKIYLYRSKISQGTRFWTLKKRPSSLNLSTNAILVPYSAKIGDFVVFLWEIQLEQSRKRFQNCKKRVLCFPNGGESKRKAKNLFFTVFETFWRLFNSNFSQKYYEIPNFRRVWYQNCVRWEV